MPYVGLVEAGVLAKASPLTSPSALQRRSCFPQTEEKVKHLKRKNAELAVIAKRLEERARKLQEANLKVVGAGTCCSWGAGLGEHLTTKTFGCLLPLS